MPSNTLVKIGVPVFLLLILLAIFGYIVFTRRMSINNSQNSQNTTAQNNPNLPTASPGSTYVLLRGTLDTWDNNTQVGSVTLDSRLFGTQRDNTTSLVVSDTTTFTCWPGPSETLDVQNAAFANEHTTPAIQMTFDQPTMLPELSSELTSNKYIFFMVEKEAFTNNKLPLPATQLIVVGC